MTRVNIVEKFVQLQPSPHQFQPLFCSLQPHLSSVFPEQQ